MTQKVRLSPRQLRFFEELRGYWHREGRPPTVRELQDIMRLKSPRSVGQFLDSLEDAGLIERGTGARNIRIIGLPPAPLDDVGKTVTVPVVGRVAAGLPMLAEENIEDRLPVSAKLARPPHRYFILRVTGDSMNKGGIKSGDMVLVRQQPTAEDGQSVVALIDDEATVKTIRIQRDHVILEPKSTNSKYQPIILERDFQVQGVVVATFRTWKKG